MKNTDQHHPSCRQEAAQADVRQSQGMQEIPVTQITPDDILADGGPITPATEDGTPTQRQIEQDVVSVNPSAAGVEFPVRVFPVVLTGFRRCFPDGNRIETSIPEAEKFEKTGVICYICDDNPYIRNIQSQIYNIQSANAASGI